MRRACKLLGKRHKYLNEHLYTRDLELWVAAGTRVRAFVFTSTNLPKARALEKTLKQSTPDNTQLWLVKDELHREKVVPVLSVLEGVSVFLGVDDHW